MGETEEFAEALLDQISVELNEEKEILDFIHAIVIIIQRIISVLLIR